MRHPCDGLATPRRCPCTRTPPRHELTVAGQMRAPSQPPCASFDVAPTAAEGSFVSWRDLARPRAISCAARRQCVAARLAPVLLLRRPLTACGLACRPLTSALSSVSNGIGADIGAVHGSPRASKVRAPCACRRASPPGRTTPLRAPHAPCPRPRQRTLTGVAASAAYHEHAPSRSTLHVATTSPAPAPSPERPAPPPSSRPQKALLRLPCRPRVTPVRPPSRAMLCAVASRVKGLQPYL